MDKTFLNRTFILLILISIISSPIAYGASDIYEEGFSEGYFQDIRNNKLIIETVEGERHIIGLDPKLELRIDGRNRIKATRDGAEDRKVELDDFKKDDLVYILIKNRKVVHLEKYQLETNSGQAYEEGNISGFFRGLGLGRINLETYNGESYRIPIKRNSKIQINGVDQNLNGLSKIKNGDWVYLELEGRYASMIESFPARGEKLYEGELVKQSESRVYFKDRRGKGVDLGVDPGARLLIDDRLVKLSDFKPGMDVFIEVFNGSIVYMDAYSTEDPAYIEPESKMVQGIVKKIDRNQIRIGRSNGEDKDYFLDESTNIIREGRASNSKSLYPGDNVKLYFDDIDTSLVSKMEIEGSSIQIKGIYKGEMKQVDPLQEISSFTKVSKLENNRWKKEEDGLRLHYNGDEAIYLGSREIKSKNLKDYRGRSGLVLLKDDLGRDSIERMILKGQQENNFSDKITNINMYSGQIELKNKKNLNIDESTLVVKNNRIVGIENLNPNADAYIVTDGLANNLTAKLIYIYNEDINNSNQGQDRIYAGRVDRVYETKIDLIDYFVLNNHNWESFSDFKELDLDDDSFIIDMEKGKRISKEDFYGGNYGVDEYNNRRDRDYYAYVYTEGDRISSMMLMKKMDPLRRQRVTSGTIMEKGSGPVGNYIKLKDSREWSPSKQAWYPRMASGFIFIDKAMLLKEGKIIEKDDLKEGDRLYMVRDDNFGRIILVK